MTHRALGIAAVASIATMAAPTMPVVSGFSRTHSVAAGFVARQSDGGQIVSGFGTIYPEIDLDVVL